MKDMMPDDGRRFKPSKAKGPGVQLEPWPRASLRKERNYDLMTDAEIDRALGVTAMSDRTTD